jgi:hypothetical protein
MPHNKRNSGIPRKRALMIHHNLRLRHQLADGLAESGWGVFEAESRTDGLPLLFDVRPDIVFLEVITGLDESWDTLRSIRLFTNAPVIILADQLSDAIERPGEKGIPTALVESIPMERVVAVAKRLGKLSSRSTGISERCSKSTTLIASLRGLSSNEVLDIDRALPKVCERDEVCLIPRRGRLRAIVKLASNSLNSSFAS